MAMIIQTVDGVVANRFEIEGQGLKFGRSSRNQVLIDDSAVSGDHAVIVKSVDDKGKEVFFIQDLGSTNGTFVNENKIEQQQLHHLIKIWTLSQGSGKIQKEILVRLLKTHLK